MQAVEGYNEAYYDEQVAGSLASARAILPILWKYFQPISIVDVGCGRGAWLRAASELGAEELLGIDGPYVADEKLLISRDQFVAADLRQRLKVDRRFSLAVCVEVAEHLPYNRAETFVADLAALSDVVLFSAAVPYQGGISHLNEQWPEFWAILFRRQGYVACDLFRSDAWADSRIEFWYAQNLLLFCKSDQAAHFPSEKLVPAGPLSLVHPFTLLANTSRYRPLAIRALDAEFEDYKRLLHEYLTETATLPLFRMFDETASWDGAEVPLFPTARSHVVDVAGEFAKCNSERERLISAYEELTAASETRAAQISQLEETLVMLRADYERVSVDRATLESQMRAAEERAAGMSAKLSYERAERGRLREQLTREQKTWDDLRTGQEAVIESLRAELAASESRPIHPIPTQQKAGRWAGSLPHRFWMLLQDIGKTSIRQAWRKRQDIKAILRSGLFDYSYYLAQNPDVANAGMDPLLHYLEFGSVEGRNPHPLFESVFYLQNNPDVATSRMNPLVHYLRSGGAEGRDPNPQFDTGFYVAAHPECLNNAMTPLAHYVQQGVFEGAKPHPNWPGVRRPANS